MGVKPKKHFSAVKLFLWIAVLRVSFAAPLFSGQIVTILGITAFKSLIARESLSIVLFFHPACPHCVAFAPHYEALAEFVAEYNRHENRAEIERIVIAHVDASKFQNEDLVASHAHGFPTVKLFASSRMISEYRGARKPKAIWNFVLSTQNSRLSPAFDLLDTRAELESFLERNRNRSRIISIFHPHAKLSAIYPRFVHFSAEDWTTTTRELRDRSNSSVAFAAVAEPSMLMPLDGSDMRFHKSKAPLQIAPALAAAPQGAEFWESVTWWYPGLRESDSIETFMHVAAIEGQNFTSLDVWMGSRIFPSRRPMAIVFSHSEPSHEDREFLRLAAMQNTNPRFLSLFANVTEHGAFAEHIGVVSSGEGEQVSRGSTYVTYREGNLLPHVSLYNEAQGDSLKQWLTIEAKKMNSSNLSTTAGEVLDLNEKNWEPLFQYDGRGVLLELYRSECASCKATSGVFAKVATRLTPHAGSVVVARFNMMKSVLPPSPELPRNATVPAIFYIPPGGQAVKFEGFPAPTAIARFARFYSETSQIYIDGPGWLGRFAAFLFYLGAVSILLGSLMWRRARKKNEHVT